MEAFLLNLSMGKAFVIGLIVAAAYWTAVYDDGSAIKGRISAAQASIVKVENEIKAIEKAVDDAKRFEEAARVLGEQMDQISRAIPSELNAFDLRKLVSTETKVIGANLVSVSQGVTARGTEGSEFLEKVTVAANIQATFVQVMMFMSNLTQVDKILTIDSLTLGRGATKDDSGAAILTANLSISAYRYVQPGAEGARK